LTIFFQEIFFSLANSRNFFSDFFHLDKTFVFIFQRHNLTSGSEIRVGNPGRKSGSEDGSKIRVGNPCQKSVSEIRVGNPCRKSVSEIRVGNPSQKSWSEIGFKNPGRKYGLEIWVKNRVDKPLNHGTCLGCFFAEFDHQNLHFFTGHTKVRKWRKWRK
jgi:hypothetical protein